MTPLQAATLKKIVERGRGGAGLQRWVATMEAAHRSAGARRGPSGFSATIAHQDGRFTRMTWDRAGEMTVTTEQPRARRRLTAGAVGKSGRAAAKISRMETAVADARARSKIQKMKKAEEYRAQINELLASLGRTTRTRR